LQTQPELLQLLHCTSALQLEAIILLVKDLAVKLEGLLLLLLLLLLFTRFIATEKKSHTPIWKIREKFWG
jgi:hypothetical protein